jgi:UDP-2-acetamido-3-amino-2,3-dideoxy-glucuronate N-acetyltransferase
VTRAHVVGDATIGDGAILGEGARLAPGVRIGVEAVVRPGAVVVADVPALAEVAGDPAVVVSYRHDVAVQVPAGGASESGWAWSLPERRQDRGNLVVLEHGSDLPFVARRCLIVHGVPPGGHRGDHAHRTLDEVVVCVHGSCRVLLDDARGRRESVLLDRPGVAVRVPPYVWTSQYGHSPDAVLMVLSSAEFDYSDYITDYATFRREVHDS